VVTEVELYQSYKKEENLEKRERIEGIFLMLESSSGSLEVADWVRLRKVLTFWGCNEECLWRFGLC
jgi:hypothetical protein